MNHQGRVGPGNFETSVEPLVIEARVGGSRPRLRFPAGNEVRGLTRVVTPDTEQRWCEVARHLTAGQLAKLVAAGRRATRNEDARQVEQRSFRWATNDDGGVTVTVRLPADVAATVVAAVRAAAEIERGVTLAQSQADAFVELLMGRSQVSVDVVTHMSDDGQVVPVVDDHSHSRPSYSHPAHKRECSPSGWTTPVGPVQEIPSKELSSGR